MPARLGKIVLAACLPLCISFTILPAHTPLQDGQNTLTRAEKKAGWQLLFDGRTTEGWRTYKNAPNDSWEVVNGELHCKMTGVQHRADLVTNKQYTSFELSFDWKVDKGANSGVLYHVAETHDHPYETGPEYQLIDDLGYPGKLEDWQKSGADYAMHPPLQIAARPQGEYNHSRIVVNGDKVEHWLNDVKVADFQAWGPEWQKLKTTGKWKDYPDYGSVKTGLIDLQDHGGGVWFRNIKIRVL
jgi:3-keto-disaccharide hydrolase